MKQFLVWLIVDVERKAPPDEDEPWNTWFIYESTIEFTQIIEERGPNRAVLTAFERVKDASKDADLKYELKEFLVFDAARNTCGIALKKALASIQ